MRRATIVLWLLTWWSMAQQPKATDAPGSVITMLGLPLRVALIRDLSSSKARLGDSIELKYFGEIRDSDGKVVLDGRARLYGRVTDVAKHDKQHPEARLGIVVERAELGGKSFRLSAVFCGELMGPPRTIRSDAHEFGSREKVTSIIPGTSGLPDDVELMRLPDQESGSVLVSKKDNINISGDAAFFVCEPRTGPDTRADARPIVPPTSLPAGVKFPVALRTEVDAAIAKAGDAVAMTFISNLNGPGDTIAIPKGADVTGRLLLAEPATKAGPSRLAIVVERAVWEGGMVSLHAFISNPPTLSVEAVSEMITQRKAPSVDLRQIVVEDLPDGGSALARTKKTIHLPAGCILLMRQAQ